MATARNVMTMDELRSAGEASLSVANLMLELRRGRDQGGVLQGAPKEGPAYPTFACSSMETTGTAKRSGEHANSDNGVEWRAPKWHPEIMLSSPGSLPSAGVQHVQEVVGDVSTIGCGEIKGAEPQHPKKGKAVKKAKKASDIRRKQRNAMYARRTYARKKTENEELRQNWVQVQDTNSRLKAEHDRLQGLVDQATRIVRLVDTVNGAASLEDGTTAQLGGFYSSTVQDVISTQQHGSLNANSRDTGKALSLQETNSFLQHSGCEPESKLPEKAALVGAIQGLTGIAPVESLLASLHASIANSVSVSATAVTDSPAPPPSHAVSAALRAALGGSGGCVPSAAEPDGLLKAAMQVHGQLALGRLAKMAGQGCAAGSVGQATAPLNPFLAQASVNAFHAAQINAFSRTMLSSLLSRSGEATTAASKPLDTKPPLAMSLSANESALIDQTAEKLAVQSVLLQLLRK